jgi:hemoglobin/transferrin/lactoferrin receptor protein
VDDLGKVFAKDEYVTVPNNSLAPEKIYSGEVGILKTMWNNKVSVQLVGYYSILSNAIVRREFVLNGQDSLDYDGEQLKILANVNTGDAVIYGSSAVISTQFNKLPNIDGAITYTHGWDTEEDMPLSHIPPIFGRLSLSKEIGKANGLKPIRVTVYSHFNGWKRLEQYGSPSVDNLSEATPDGTPSWATLNFIASYKLYIRQKHLEKPIMTDDFANEKALVFQLGIENILDQHYKSFSSGMSAPGRNIIVSLRASF